MKLFGPLHISLLVAIGGLAASVALLCRRCILPARQTRLTLAWLIAANELVWWIFRYSHEGVHIGNLPLQLCDFTVWLAVLACLTLAPAIVELAYFAGMAGAGMALLTPDLYSPWPTYPAIYFFIAHGAIVVAASLLAFGGVARFRSGAVWRSFGLLLAYAALVGLLDAVFGTNYMYLRNKPANASLLDQMGPWPWYLAAAAVLALTLFGLLWLPLRFRTASDTQRARCAHS